MKAFEFFSEQFDDIKILRYEVPAFETLPLKEKLFVYYLSRLPLPGVIYCGIRIINTILGFEKY